MLPEVKKCFYFGISSVYVQYTACWMETTVDSALGIELRLVNFFIIIFLCFKKDPFFPSSKGSLCLLTQ